MPWRCSTISEGALESFACQAGASTESWTRGDWRVRQIVDYKTVRIGEAILRVLRAK
jgi:hypothetical protein